MFLLLDYRKCKQVEKIIQQIKLYFANEITRLFSYVIKSVDLIPPREG